MRIPGFSSTGSKRPESLYGAGAPVGLPVRLSRSEGAMVWDDEGRGYIDFIMGLGAVALGYGHPEVNQAAHAAIDSGVVGPLPPENEERLAEQLAQSASTRSLSKRSLHLQQCHRATHQPPLRRMP